MNFRFENDIILEDDTLLLRPIKKEDIGNLSPVALAYKDLLQFSPKQVYTRKLLGQYINDAISLRINELRYSFILFDKLKGLYVGSTAFLNVSNADDRLEIGATWIDRELHGTGLNRRCKTCFCNMHSMNSRRTGSNSEPTKGTCSREKRSKILAEN